MDSFYLILLIILVVAVLILLQAFKPEWLKKAWAYIVAGVVGLGAVVFLFSRKKNPVAPDPKIQAKEDKLKEDLDALHNEIEQEIAEAKDKEEEVLEELDEIQEIDEEEERLKRLADLLNKTRRK